jgi:hypothetical protein
LKKFIKRKIRNYLRATSRRKNNSLIKQKLEVLKQRKSKKSFPVNEVEPLIRKYSFYKKSDQLYLDFFYSVSNFKDPNFLSLPIYYNVVEPVMNNISQLKGIKDKNFLDLLFPGVNTPSTILRKMNEGYYDQNFHPVQLTENVLVSLTDSWEKLILKPANESGAGKSIKLFKKKDEVFIDNKGKKLNMSLLNDYPDFLLQEAVWQHEFYRKFNPDSNNTMRILTYRSIKDEQVHILHKLLRVGAKGSFLDHDNKGGIAIGISQEHILNNYGFTRQGERLNKFNEINFQAIEKVPFIDKMENISKELASKVFYGRILAFDFTVNQNGNVLLLEINAWRNGISQYQMNNGSVFGSFTKEVLDFCENKEYNHIIVV